MSESMTFNIVEGYEPVIDYDEFKEDFLNPSTRVPDLKKKYGLSKTRWLKYRNRVYEDAGISKKPTDNYGNNLVKSLAYRMSEKKHDMSFIQKMGNGYAVIKTLNKITYNFGRYKDVECAKKVRDILYESNWDLELGEELKFRYSVSRRSMTDDEIHEQYLKFEDMYLHSNKTIDKVRKELKLSTKRYMLFVKELKDKYGHYHRSVLKRKYDSEM